MSDYSIIVPEDRKFIINQLRVRGVIVNQQNRVQVLKKKLEALLAKEHPIHEYVNCLDNEVIKRLHSKLQLVKPNSRSVQRLKNPIIDYDLSFSNRRNLNTHGECVHMNTVVGVSM